MTIYDDPNREAVGLAPIWTGAGDVVEPVDGSDVFDPYDHTAAEVRAYLAEHPEDADRVLDAERAGKARTTVLEAT